jgi:hypothetical protein
MWSKTTRKDGRNMRTRMRACAALIVTVSGLGAAYADGIEQGQFRLGLHTGLFQATSAELDGSDVSSDSMLFGLGGTILGVTGGYAATPSLELGGVFAYVNQTVDATEASRLIAGAYGGYNFDAGTMTLFADVMILTSSHQQRGLDVSQFLYGGSVGAKIFVASHASIDVGLRFLLISGDIEVDGANADFHGTELTGYAGLSIWLGGASTAPAPPP